MHIHTYTTIPQQATFRTEVTSLDFRPDTEGMEQGLINLYPQRQYQTFQGFGGAFTDAAGYTFAQMPPEAQADIIAAYFGEGGLGYTQGRTHLDSCDFSVEMYEAMSDPQDTELASFSLERGNRYILPLLQRATEAAAAPLSLMVTPWSPPAFMKTNGMRKQGGYLKEEYYPLWAKYICRYIQELQALGLRITMLSVQNEPKAVQTWDSCVFTAEQERAFVRDHLRPEMARTGLADIDLLIWDHNKERAFERVCDVIDSPKMEELIQGVAVHWYSGDHFEVLRMIHEVYPKLRIVFSEACVEYLVQKDQSQIRNAHQYAHEIIGSMNNGLDTFLDWNLILDMQGGPNHVGNYCDAPIMCDTRTGEVHRNLSYYYIGHFSKYIKPQARRIGFSRFSRDIEVIAVQNPDGQLCVVCLNTTDKEIAFHLRLAEQICPLTIGPHAIKTCLIEK